MEQNPKSNPIIVKCKGAGTLPIDRILEFQGGLKKLSNKNRDKLITSILRRGFIAPVFVWDNQGDYSLLDGHQRLKTLLYLRQKGWDIPMIPVVYVEAENEKDARAKLLAITSQYGEFDMDLLNEWMAELDSDIADTIRLVDEELDVKSSGDGEGDGEPDVPISKPGDVWQLGKNSFTCGDIKKTELLYCDAMVNRYVDWCGSYGKKPNVKLNGETWYG